MLFGIPQLWRVLERPTRINRNNTKPRREGREQGTAVLPFLATGTALRKCGPNQTGAIAAG